MRLLAFLLFWIPSFLLFGQKRPDDPINLRDMIIFCNTNGKEIDKALKRKQFEPIALCYDGEKKVFRSPSFLFTSYMTVWMASEKIMEIWYDYPSKDKHLELMQAVQNAKGSTYNRTASNAMNKDGKTVSSVYDLKIKDQTYEITFLAIQETNKVFSIPQCDQAGGAKYRMTIERN